MVLIAEACEHFLNYCQLERKLSPHTVRAYRRDLSCFVEVTGGHHPLQDFSETWIEAAVRQWSRNPDLKVITVKRRAACIKAFVRWMFRRRLLTFNPLERICLEFKIPKRLPRNLRTDEIRQLVAWIPTVGDGGAALPSRREWDQLTARLAIEVLTLTGVRIGELVKIQPRDMDRLLGQIRIVGKGNRERSVSFPDTVTFERLSAYHAQVTSRFGSSALATALFFNGLGKPANEQYLRRVIRRYAETAQLSRRITPHMLRHTAATQLLEAGLDMRFVQRLLGHSSITTTELYTHVADHVLRNEITRANVRERLEMIDN
jgi:integrase/recombinase XerD